MNQSAADKTETQFMTHDSMIVMMMKRNTFESMRYKKHHCKLCNGSALVGISRQLNHALTNDSEFWNNGTLIFMYQFQDSNNQSTVFNQTISN